MLKKLMITTAIGGLMIGSAAAQSAPAENQPASPPASTAAPQSGAPAASATVINSQRPDQWLASKFKGTNVLGPDNQKIGDVSDVMFDKTAKVDAIIISVGGFLGIGAKEVAVAPNAVEYIPGDANNPNDFKLKVGMNKEQLQQAANFEKYSPPRASTTGSGPAGGPARPSPSPAAR
jgi:hypothetical protein